MRIGKLPETAETVKLNVWHVGAQLSIRPNWMIEGIRPQLYACCVKVLDVGESPKRSCRKGPCLQDGNDGGIFHEGECEIELSGGREPVTRGFYWRLVFPVGILVKLLR